MAESFEGKWVVDASQSDSIEPMLKGMGVGWKIRKIVTLLKVVQKIEVRGEELVVSNISKHGRDSTTHLLNAGQRVIKTSRGDQVLDECTYDARREFPLEIIAILPSNKGSTVDRRKILPGGDQFVQHLTYKYPEGSGTPDILMKRVFSRAPAEAADDDEPAAKAASALRKRRSQPDAEAAKAPAAGKAQSQLQHKQQAKQQHTLVGEVHSHIEQVTGHNPEPVGTDAGPNSPDLWVFALLCMVAFTLLFAGLDAGAVAHHVAAPAMALVAVLFLAARVAARTESGMQLALDARVRWGAFVTCFAAGTAVLGASSRGAFEGHPVLQALFLGAASIATVISRVNAGPTLDVVNEGAKVPLAQALAAAALCASAILGASAPASLGLHLVTCYVAAAVAYERLVGYARFETRDTNKSSEGAASRVADKEGNTLRAAVVGHRVVDDLYAQYKVQVEHEGLQWVVWRRFSQFDNLRHELRRVFGHGVLPQLPSKTWFSSLDDDFLEDRAAELDDFVQKLFEPSGLRNQVFKIAETKKFLGVGQGRGKPPSEAAADAAASIKASPEETKQLVALLRDARDKFDKALHVGEGDGWKFLKKHQGVQCYLKTDGDLTYTKGIGTITGDPLQVAAFMADQSQRKNYDDLFKKDTMLRELDLVDVSEGLDGAPVDICDVKHVEFKSPFPMAIAARDSVLLSCRMIEPDGTVTVILVSPPDSFFPPTPKYTRAKVFVAGIKLSPNPAKPGSCIMSNVQMMDPNGSIPGWIVKAVAPERCAMSAKVDAAISKLPALPAPLPVPPVPSRD